MFLKSAPLELRGIANRTNTKSGNVYYVMNMETDDGTPWQFYCPSAEAFPQGLKKADKVCVTFEVKRFQNKDSLIVHKVEKVG